MIRRLPLRVARPLTALRCLLTGLALFTALAAADPSLSSLFRRHQHLRRFVGYETDDGQQRGRRLSDPSPSAEASELSAPSPAPSQPVDGAGPDKQPVVLTIAGVLLAVGFLVMVAVALRRQDKQRRENEERAIRLDGPSDDDEQSEGVGLMDDDERSDRRSKERDYDA